MTASDSIRYRLALADGFLREARQESRCDGRAAAAGRRHLGLVDCASFDVRRRANVTTALAYNQPFGDPGLGRA